MKKSKKILSLDKLVISRLNVTSNVKGGQDIMDIDVATRKTKNEDICPTGTLTCPYTYFFGCDNTTNPYQTAQGC